jgi:peptide/nickel transport system substrate-binding protein
VQSHLAHRIAAAALLAGSALALASPAKAQKNINAVLESEVVFLDPHFTTATITRTFGYHVYDTLFSMDGKGDIKPQMVKDSTVSPDQLTYTFTLRDGLKWHDGNPVTAADCIASLKRWMPKDSLGRMLAAALDSLQSPDPKTIVLKLKTPFPLVLQTLGKPNALVPFMLPERLANTPVSSKLTEEDGSGPFILRKDLWRTGDTMVLERNPAYVPRDEPPDFLAGGKKVNIDRLTLKVMPDRTTAANALTSGEIDYLQFVPFDWIPKLQKTKGVKVMALGIDQYQGNFRLNAAAPPFNDPAVRRVLWKLVDQKTMLEATGLPDGFYLANCASFWMCGTPYETNAGADIAKFSIADAKAELARTGYKGEKVVMMELGNDPTQMQVSQVLASNLREAGFTVDEQVTDWGTVLARRVNKDGWSMFGVYSNGADMMSPLTHFYVSNNCADYPGWSCDERVSGLLKQFANAGDQDARKKIAAQIQVDEYESTPSVMWGQFTLPAAYRTTLTDLVQSSFPMFWAVDKK